MTDTIDLAATNDTGAAFIVLFADLKTYRTVSGVRVNPALAKRIIALNADNNRNIKPTVCTRYARDMRNKHWRERTGQTVKMGTDGRLLDGAHRMHAVVEADTTVEFDFTFGVNPADMPVIDSGAGRSPGDVIKISGGSDMFRVAAIVRRLWAWDMGSYMGTTGALTPTPIEMQDKYNAEALVFDAAAARALDCTQRRLGAGASMGAAYMLFHRIDPATCHRFFDAFVSGANLPEGSAILVLRTRLQRRKLDKASPSDQLALMIRAWNAYNTLDKDGNRVFVDKLQLTRKGELGNTNFPKPGKAVTGADDDA